MTNANNGTSVATDNDVVMDQYGRTEAERTVVLSSDDAEAVDREVTMGKHQTYDDALAYQLAHGRKELERTRKAQAELRAARQLRNQIKLQEELFKQHPELIADPNVVAKVMAALGIKLPAAR